jgi:hypothetical protein
LLSLGGAITVHLGGVTTTPDPHADIDLLELVRAHEQHRLEDLVAESLRLEKLDGVAVDLQDALSALAVRDGNRVLLLRQEGTTVSVCGTHDRGG